ncbi:hypothetical protein FTUN_7801 [Frigoriglobus tundricola]|uniref:Uncharacterized protein n=1 Tax=Frigoriglobus tundricola TaxID=2774151 RepID=A0A6M5Z363_9BACT|nr:hypothetical protein FTUN_7801 [Frigoriglobus tundricola]
MVQAHFSGGALPACLYQDHQTGSSSAGTFRSTLRPAETGAPPGGRIARPVRCLPITSQKVSIGRRHRCPPGIGVGTRTEVPNATISQTNVNAARVGSGGPPFIAHDIEGIGGHKELGSRPGDPDRPVGRRHPATEQPRIAVAGIAVVGTGVFGVGTLPLVDPTHPERDAATVPRTPGVLFGEQDRVGGAVLERAGDAGLPVPVGGRVVDPAEDLEVGPVGQVARGPVREVAETRIARWWATCIAPLAGSTIRIAPTPDRSVPRPLPVFSGASARRHPCGGACGPASRSCS